jgi:hypothetical protein
MKRNTQYLLYGYAGFCAVNWALTYYAARSGSPLLFGSASLLSLNETLRKVNALSYLVDPLAVAQKAGSSSAGQASTGTAVCVTAGGVTACAPPDPTLGP